MKTLYHASPQKELKILKPQYTLSNNRYIGDYLFATEHKILAIMYLVNKSTDVLMNMESKKPRIIIQSTLLDYKKNDKGGAIYELAPDNFETTPQPGLSNMELVCRSPLVPLDKEVFDTSLEAFKKAGIEIYFVTKSTFNEIINEKNEEEIIAMIESNK